MQCTFAHNNLNVLDLEKSLAFYEKALGLRVVRKKKRRISPCAFFQTAPRPTGWS